MTGHPDTGRPIDGGGIFQAALDLCRENALVLVGVPFVAGLGVTVIEVVLDGALQGAGTAVNLLFGPVIYALSVLLAADAIRGEWTAFPQMVNRVMDKWLVLIAISLLSAFVMALGFVLLIVPGVYLMGVLFCTTPIILFESNPWAAMNRSYELTRDQAWAVVGIIFRIVLAAIVVGIGVLIVASLLSAVALPVFGAGLILAFSAGVGAVSAAAALLVYLHLTGSGHQDLEAVFR